MMIKSCVDFNHLTTMMIKMLAAGAIALIQSVVSADHPSLRGQVAKLQAVSQFFDLLVCRVDEIVSNLSPAHTAVLESTIQQESHAETKTTDCIPNTIPYGWEAPPGGDCMQPLL